MKSSKKSSEGIKGDNFNSNDYKKDEVEHFYYSNGRDDIAGWAMIVLALIGTSGIIIVSIAIYQKEDILKMIYIFAIIAGVVVLQLIGGVRLVKRNTSKDKLRVIRKKVLIVCFYIVIIVGGFLVFNNLILIKEKNIKIEDVVSVKLLEENDKAYMIIEDKGISLRCDEVVFDEIYKLKITDEKISIDIHYEYNLLTPHKGLIIKFERIESDLNR